MSQTPETDAFIEALNDDWDYEFAALTSHAKNMERQRDLAREAFAIATDELEQAESALREIHTIVQLRFAEWAPANDLNDGSEEAAK